MLMHGGGSNSTAAVKYLIELSGHHYNDGDKIRKSGKAGGFYKLVKLVL